MDATVLDILKKIKVVPEVPHAVVSAILSRSDAKSLISRVSVKQGTGIKTTFTTRKNGYSVRLAKGWHFQTKDEQETGLLRAIAGIICHDIYGCRVSPWIFSSVLKTVKGTVL